MTAETRSASETVSDLPVANDSAAPSLLSRLTRLWRGGALPEAADDGAEPSTVWAIVRGAAWSLMAQLAAMSVFINLLTLAVPVFVLQVYDRVVPHAGFETLKGLLIGILLLIGFDFILRQARGRVLQMIALRTDIALSRRLFARLSGLPLRELERRGDSEWRMALRDVDTVRDFVAGPTALLVIDLPFVLFFIGVIAVIAPPLAGVLVMLLPIYIALAFVASLYVGRASQHEATAAQTKSKLTEEIVSGRSP